MMKKMITLLSALALTLLPGQADARKKSADDYNYRKACEVLQDENDEAKAMGLVNAQLKQTPDHVDALLLRVRLERRKKDYAAALTDINHAIRANKPKASGTPNSTLYWWKGYVYNEMNDPFSAAAALKTAYTLARKDNKENYSSIAFDYAQALFDTGDLDGSDAVCRGILAEDEAYLPARVGLARNLLERKQYRAAADLLEKCRNMDAEYAESYRFLMQACEGLGETTRTIDAALDWFEKDQDAPMDSVAVRMALRPNYAVAQVKARERKSEEPIAWKILLCNYYQNYHRYTEALPIFDEIEREYGQYDPVNVRRAQCLSELGLYDQAIAEISKVLDKKPDWYCLMTRGDFYRGSGRMEEALADYTAAMEEAPAEGYAYYRRGWTYELSGDLKRAMEDYNMGVDIDGSIPHLYLLRGELRLLEGDREGAEADFRMILQKDTVADMSSCRHYALHFLGDDAEAEAWMDRVIASDPEHAGNYYDQACLYARMGRLEDAVAALRAAFEKGFRRFSHIRLDDDMDPIRDLPAFKALIEEYEARHADWLREQDIVPAPSEPVITEIAMTRRSGGTFEIPCAINGLPLQMLFDTGASDVTISSVEANFMFKNGYLSEKDIKGKKYYQIANGEITAGTVVTLREVKVGDAVLHNVDASVVKSQKAPLLLGQSAMERFGTITIDNQNNKLIIKH